MVDISYVETTAIPNIELLLLVVVVDVRLVAVGVRHKKQSYVNTVAGAAARMAEVRQRSSVSRPYHPVPRHRARGCWSCR